MVLPKNLLNENLNAIQNAASDFKARQRNLSVDEYEREIELPTTSKALFDMIYKKQTMHQMPLKNIFAKLENDYMDLIKNPIQTFKQPDFSLFQVSVIPMEQMTENQQNPPENAVLETTALADLQPTISAQRLEPEPSNTKSRQSTMKSSQTIRLHPTSL